MDEHVDITVTFTHWLHYVVVQIFRYYKWTFQNLCGEFSDLYGCKFFRCYWICVARRCRIDMNVTNFIVRKYMILFILRNNWNKFNRKMLFLQLNYVPKNQLKTESNCKKKVLTRSANKWTWNNHQLLYECKIYE